MSTTVVITDQWAIDLAINLVITIVVWTIAVAPSLWLSGRLIAGKEKARFIDAVSAVIVGTIIFYFVGFAIQMFLAHITGSLLISYLVLLVVWLALVNHFFDCGWLKAFAITVVALVIAVVLLAVVGYVLPLLGYSAGWIPNPLQLIPAI